MSWRFSNIFNNVAADALVLCIIFYGANANLTWPELCPDPLDPNGNITIVWDVTNATSHSYTATVLIYNFQKYRQVEPPGWILGWTWVDNEVIWGLKGARMIDKDDDCSKYNGDAPYSCDKHPGITDLYFATPDNQHLPNCCKAGVLRSWLSSPRDATSSFEIVVSAGSKRPVDPMAFANIILSAPGGNYVCKEANELKIGYDDYLSRDIVKKWQVVCPYTQAQEKNPIFSVTSFSFLNIDSVSPCPTCGCGCKNNGSPTPAIVNWNIKSRSKKRWHSDVAILSFPESFSYSDWNLFIHHPHFKNATHIIGSDSKFFAIVPPRLILLWGESISGVKQHIPKADIFSFHDVLIYFYGDKPAVEATVLLLSFLPEEPVENWIEGDEKNHYGFFG